MCKVIGIPENQLKIASLGRARLEKGYPSAIKLVNAGVPKGLANALAPFQRGGVDFVIDKDGRALIADGTYRRRRLRRVLCFFQSVCDDFGTVLTLLRTLRLDLSRYGSREGKFYVAMFVFIFWTRM
jgi:hypothetical protein